MTAVVLPFRARGVAVPGSLPEPAPADIDTAEHEAAARIVADFGRLRALMVARHVIMLAAIAEHGDDATAPTPPPRNQVRERLGVAFRSITRAMRLVLRRARA